MNNLRAIALMIAAMVFFTAGDTGIKLATASISSAQILIALGLFGGVIFAIFTRLQGHRVFTRDVVRPVLIWRNVSEIGGTALMVLALSKVDLSLLAAIFQGVPLVVTLGAALVLKEKVGWRRWLAIMVGLGGVLIIIRPGSAVFEPELLLPLAAMIFLSMRDLSTRLIPTTIPTLRVATYGMSSLVIAGLILMAFGEKLTPMSLSVSAIVALTTLAGVAGYWTITAAMRMGEVSAVAPFRYSRILFALAAGYFVFGERPDAWTLLGAAITVLAGLYIFAREGRMHQRK